MPSHHSRLRAIALGSTLLPVFAPGAVQAQASQVTLYGIVDLAVRQARGLSEFAPSPGSVSSVTSGIGNTSVFGFRGSEDLGQGLKAVFQLESGINADTGSNASSSKLFDRQAWVGLQTPYGTLTLGRQRALLGDSVSPVDPLGMRLASYNPNINIASLSQHRLGDDYGSAGSTSGSYRLDNAAKLVSKLGSFTLRAMLAAGEGNSGRAAGGGLTYEEGPLALSGAYMQFKNIEQRSIDAWVAGAGYKIGSARLTFTWGESEAETDANETTDFRTIAVGLALPVSEKLQLVTGYYLVDRERTGLRDDGFGRAVAFLEYAASKRTRLFAELDSTDWKDGFQGEGNRSTGTGLSLGISHNF